MKNTYKVTAIVNADGAVGIMFGGELAPIFGKLRADNLGATYIDLELASMQVQTTARTIRFTRLDGQLPINGPNGTSVQHTIEFRTVLARTGNVK